MLNSKKTLGLSEMIQRVKDDLMNKQPQNEPDLFSIDEVVLEINFTISGDIEGGFDFGVVTLGSNVSEERVQKVKIKMTPLISKQQQIELINQDNENAQHVIKVSSKKLLRGG